MRIHFLYTICSFEIQVCVAQHQSAPEVASDAIQLHIQLFCWIIDTILIKAFAKSLLYNGLRSDFSYFLSRSLANIVLKVEHF